MNWTIAVLIAALSAMLIVTISAQKPPRHHSYWCRIEACATDGWQRACMTDGDHCSAFKGIQLDI